jgi:hypothetical protein
VYGAAEIGIVPLLEHHRRFEPSILDPELHAAIDVANPIRPQVFRHDEIFGVQCNESEFDFPRQTTDTT